MFDFDVAGTTNKLVRFIQDACRKERCRNVLLGVSGGIDSATCLFLAVKALGKEHVHPVLLPYEELHSEAIKDAWAVIDVLQIPHEHVRLVDIKPFVDSVALYDAKMEEGRMGNIMARVRMVLLYDLSKKLNYLVLGTENKSEHLLGYYTRFGDEASDIEPIRGLYKTQVYQLARRLGVPEKILTKPPSAGLWEDQTDEGEFGFSYRQADEVLFLHFEGKLSGGEIIKKGYDKNTVEKIWWWIEKGKLKSRLPHVASLKPTKIEK